MAIYYSLELASSLNIAKLQVIGDSKHVIQNMKNNNLKGAKRQNLRKMIENLPLPIDILFFHVLRSLDSIADRLVNIGVTLGKGQLLQNNVSGHKFIP